MLTESIEKSDAIDEIYLNDTNNYAIASGMSKRFTCHYARTIQ